MKEKSWFHSATAFAALLNGYVLGDNPPKPGEALCDPGPSRILHFDTRALYDALNGERNRRRLTWKQVADELPGFRVGTLTNLSKGPLMGFPRVMLLTQWVGRPVANFVRDRSR